MARMPIFRKPQSRSRHRRQVVPASEKRNGIRQAVFQYFDICSGKAGKRCTGGIADGKCYIYEVYVDAYGRGFLRGIHRQQAGQ